MERAVAVTEQLVALASRFESAAGKKGGYLCLGYGDSSRKAKIGEVPSEKDEKYSRLAGEKVFRSRLTDMTSWATRDPAKDMWGGAIPGRRFVYGFSGFPELWDEALVLMLAVVLHDLSLSRARRFAALSGNGYFALLYDAFVN